MIYIILPAYNEERNIGTVLKKIYESVGSTSYYSVVVVNDGSIDGTYRVATSFQKLMPLKIINHKVNRGLGKALKTGLEYVCRISRPEDIIITMDADNTHDPITINPKMVDKINQGFDIAIASRFQRGGEELGVSLLRKLLSRGVTVLLKMFFPIKGVRDYSSGYRAYKAEIIKKGFEKYGEALIESKGFACMAELLIKLRILTPKIVEVPLILQYHLKDGSSKLNIHKTILGYLSVLFRNFGKKW